MRYRIRELRKEKGLSQQELANKARCTRQFINMLENSDEINISTKMLIRSTLMTYWKMSDFTTYTAASTRISPTARQSWQQRTSSAAMKTAWRNTRFLTKTPPESHDPF